MPEPNRSHPREREVFLEAVEIEEASTRSAFLDTACAGDPELRMRVEALLAAGDSDDFEPPAEFDALISELGTDPGAGGLAGTEIGPYTLIEEIGAGGMGSVWRARQDAPVQREVAIKMIRRGMGTEELLRRFGSERQALAMLDSPHIARLYDAGSTEGGRPYFVMELVEGVPITAYCEREGLDVANRLAMFRKVCEAVGHAHQKGVIHRDLKPSNILVTREGDLKMIDFGVARIVESEKDGRTLLTREFSIIGTPGYMSPEQAGGEPDIDTRADVYALGALLYELLVGQAPFSSEELRTAAVDEIRRMIREDEPLRPSTRMARMAAGNIGTPCSDSSSRLRGDLDWIVMQALAKERERRYQTVDALSEDVRRHLENEPVTAAAPSWAYRTGKFVRKYRVGVAWGSVALLAVLAGGMFSAIQAVRAGRAEAREKEARVQTQWVLADSYVNLGLREAEAKEFARAKLWFEEAAALSAGDPHRAVANRMRAQAFGALAATPLRVVKGPHFTAHLTDIHPSRPVIVVHMDDFRSFWILDLGRERTLRPPGMPENGFTAVGFDPSSDRFATSSGEGMLTLRRFPDGEVVRELDLGGEIGRISHLTWSDDGALLFLGATGGRIYDVGTGELWPAVLPHDYGKDAHPLIRSAAFGPGKRSLVSTGHWPQWTMKLFQLDPDAGTAREVPLGPDPRHSGREVPQFVGNGAWMVGTVADRIRAYECASGRVLGEFAPGSTPPARFPPELIRAIEERPMLGHYLPPNRSVVPGTTTMATNTPQGFHDLATDRKEVRSKYAGWVRGFLAPDGGAPVAVMEHGDYFSLWRHPQDRRMWSMPCGQDSRPVFSHDGKFLAAAGPHQRELQVHEVAGRRPAATPVTTDGVIRTLAFSPTDNGLVAIGLPGHTPAAGQIEFWDWRSGRRTGEAVALGANPITLCYHPGGDWIAVSTDDGRVLRVESVPETPRLLFETRGIPASDTLVFIEDVGAQGTLVAGRSDAEDLPSFTHVWDLATASLRYAPLEHPAHRWPKSYDYRDGILITPSGTHTFCDLATGEAIPSPLVDRLGDDRIVFGNDNDTVVTSGRGTGARVIDWHTGLPRSPDLVHEFRDVRWVHRSLPIPGTPWIAVCGMNGIRIFDSHSGRPVAPPIEWKESERLWLTPHCVRSPCEAVLACNVNRALIHVVDLSNLREAVEPRRDAALDELRAGARLESGGLVELRRVPEWMERWKAYRAAHPEAFALK